MKPRSSENTIRWKRTGVITADDIFKAHGIEEEGKSQAPSMWEYDARCLPKEFVGLDRETFLTNPTGMNLCFLGTDVLAKICSMLIPLDFVNLSRTCRFLHWRMFTLCKCYAPYKVRLVIKDAKIVKDRSWDSMPKMVYFFDGDISSRDDLLDEESRKYYSGRRGHRGIFVRQPSCLKKPFIFECLRLYLYIPFFEEACYERCLPHILPIRKYADRLNIIFCFYKMHPREQLINFPDTNNFFEAVSATTYRMWYEGENPMCPDGSRRQIKMIYLNCPYARQMDEASIIANSELCHAIGDVFLNRTGCFRYPTEGAIQRTMNEFFYGSTNLEFHSYCYHVQRNNSCKTAILEYLFGKYTSFEEYYSQRHGHIWSMTIMTEENGRKHKLVINKSSRFADILVGKETSFDKTARKHLLHRDHITSRDDEPLEEWWKMDTALEPEDEGRKKSASKRKRKKSVWETKRKRRIA